MSPVLGRGERGDDWVNIGGRNVPRSLIEFGRRDLVRVRMVADLPSRHTRREILDACDILEGVGGWTDRERARQLRAALRPGRRLWWRLFFRGAARTLAIAGPLAALLALALWLIFKT